MTATVLRDIVFSTVVGFRPVSLDLHLPDGLGPFPVVVFVHGGGWLRGSRASFGPNLTPAQSFDRIVEAGFAVASIDYRLSGEAKFPAQVDDARAALEWLRQNGAAHGLDASRIVVWGESAGATIGALVALEPDSGVAGVVDWYGPSNLVSFATVADPAELHETRESQWLGATAIEAPDLARAASPVFQVTASAPPFLIAHGTADRFVPFSQSEELREALQALGVRVDFTAVEGGDHMWNDVTDPTPLVTQAITFAKSVTGGSHAG